jgi:hypothetical protein
MTAKFESVDRYGGYDVIEIDSRKEALKKSHIDALAGGRTPAIRLKNFCSAAVRKTMLDTFMSDNEQATHPAAYDAGWSIGLSVSAALRSAEYAAQYLDEEERVRAKIRGASGDAASPLDKLTAELFGAWPHGVSGSSFPGLGRMHTATVRALKANVDLLAHTIDLGLKQFAGWPEFFGKLRAVFSCNLYLQCRAPGGQLLLYLRRLPEDEIARLKGDGYGIPLELLGEPAVILQPEEGEVIIFESTKLHGVAASEHPRVTMGGFIFIPKSETPIMMGV